MTISLFRVRVQNSPGLRKLTARIHTLLIHVTNIFFHLHLRFNSYKKMKIKKDMMPFSSKFVIFPLLICNT